MTESAESDWKQVLEKALPSANLRWSEFRNQHRVDVPASAIVAVLTALRDAGMDQLCDLTAVDLLEYPGATDRLEVVYLLLKARSLRHVWDSL